MVGLSVRATAAARGLPIIVVNQGRTSADDLMTYKLDDCAPLLGDTFREH